MIGSKTPDTTAPDKNDAGWGAELKRHAGRIFLPPLSLIAIMVILEIIDTVLPLNMDQLGIRSWNLSGIPGIAFAPFLHLGFAHLLANAGTFLVLGVLVGLITKRFWTVFAAIALLGGIGTWLLGWPGTVHVGASGVVYGFAAFLITYGFVARRVGAALVAILVVITYGGLVLGFVPGNPYVSWQGHIAGAVAGVVVGLWLGSQDRKARAKSVEA